MGRGKVLLVCMSLAAILAAAAAVSGRRNPRRRGGPAGLKGPPGDLTNFWRDTMKKARGPQAAVLLEKGLLARYPNNPEVQYMMALAWGARGDRTRSMAYLRKALAGGVSFNRALLDARLALACLKETPEFQALARKADVLLLTGPMLGCVTDRSAKFWVRAPAETPVRVAVSASETLADPVRSPPVTAREADDCTAVAEVKGLEPNTTYYYDVLVGGRSALKPKYPSFRTYPARGRKARFRVAFGGGARYMPANERMWDTIASFRPLAFLFLGDNIYIDCNTNLDVHRYLYYRRQLRPEYRRLCASTAVYAVWDDHDMGLNDCSGGPELFTPKWKFAAWHVFRRNWNNPYYGGGAKQPGSWHDFSIGDVDVFMTDGRYYRSFKDGTMLGPVQKAWLLNKLRASKATFKVIASGTLWTEHADKKGRDSWWGVKKEREEVFSLINTEKIDGVILISADRHRSEIWKIERPGGYPLYEFESSKLTNTHTHGTRKEALFSYNKGNLFGLLTFDLTKPDPEVSLQIVNIDKEIIHTLTLKKSRISHK